MTSLAVPPHRERPRAAAPRSVARLERESQLGRLTELVAHLARRHPHLHPDVVRQQTVEVLCLGLPEHAAPTHVMRLVEARLHALG